MEKIKEEYEKLRKKYKLPAFEDVEKQFSISEIDDCSSILGCIREKIGERIFKSCQVIEEILQPDTNITNLYESRIFDDEDKKAVFALYRGLMALRRKAETSYILNEPDKDAEFIGLALEKWMGLKQVLVQITTKLEDSWGKDLEKADKLVYFG